MKKRLMTFMLAAALMAILLCLSPINAKAGEFKTVTSIELQQMISDGQDIKIIDVRDGATYKSGHIEGSINIPYEVADARLMKELKPSERIVFVCYGGPTGDGFAEMLVKNNYKKVYSLSGGMRYWDGRVVK